MFIIPSVDYKYTGTWGVICSFAPAATSITCCQLGRREKGIHAFAFQLGSTWLLKMCCWLLTTWLQACTCQVRYLLKYPRVGTLQCMPLSVSIVDLIINSRQAKAQLPTVSWAQYNTLRMSSFPLRLGLWSSLVVVAVAVYLRLQQQPLQDVFGPDDANQTFCYAKGVTAKFSTGSGATCFTVRDGVFVDVFTPKSESPPSPEARLHEGHAIPGLWDGVSPALLISLVCRCYGY